MMYEYTMYLLCGILSAWKTQNRAKIQNDTKCEMTNHPDARSARIQIYTGAGENIYNTYNTHKVFSSRYIASYRKEHFFSTKSRKVS